MRPIHDETGSFSPPSALVAGVIPLDMPPAPPVPVNLLDLYYPDFDVPNASLPMTGYQRIYQWPAVGPVSEAGLYPVKVAPPQELLPVLKDTIAAPILSVPMPFDQVRDECAPLFSVMPGITCPRSEVYLMPAKENWTMMPTDPIAFIIPSAVLEGSSAIFRVLGITKDGTGTPLAGVTVLVINTEALNTITDPLNEPVQGITTSDGSGNYSVIVNGRGAYQALGYLSGLPDRAGVTVNTVKAAET